MEDNSNSADDRAKVRRSAQACQRCRTLKARCLPSSEEGTCQRCFRSGCECAWGERRLRQRKQGSSRIVQVEKKIDRLFARIAGGNEGSSPPDGSSPGRKALWKGSILSPADTVDQHAEALDDDNESNHSLDEVSKLHEFDLSAEDGKGSFQVQVKAPARDDPLSKTLAAQPEAEELFDQYKPMSVSFPFVPITDEMTFESVCVEKPMLLLAIMAVSSWRNKKLQMQFEKQYRTELATRTLVSPHKDLTLLQSILVYVAWSHWYVDARVRNPATILHLAAALLSDLKLLPKATTNEFEFISCARVAIDNAEQQRTVLGCYYMCATVRAEFSISTLLEYRPWMHEWSRTLSERCECESDSIIELLIESRRVSDMTYAHTLYENQSVASISGDQLLEVFRLWSNQCQDWKRLHGRHEQARLLDMLQYSLETKLYKILASEFNRAPQDGVDTAHQRYRQLASLSSQLEAGKTFFDTLVAVPTDATHLISFPEWTTVPRMVMDMARLSMFSSSHPPEWNTKDAQDRIRLNLYLDSLCFKMHNMTTYNPPEQPHPDYWTVMKGIMQAVNAWYVKKMKAGSESRKAHSSTQSGGGSGVDGSNVGTYQGGMGTDSSGSAAYGAPTPGMFDDSSFDFLGSFNPQQGSHCVWMPMDLQMSIDAMLDTDLNW